MEEEFTATMKKYETVLECVDQKLASIIAADRFLNDLIPKSKELENDVLHLPSNKDVMNTIEIHFGRAMRLTLLRGDGVRLPLVVPVDARVLELRWAVQEAISSYMNHISNLPEANHKGGFTDNTSSQRRISAKSISWRSIWKTKCLAVVNPNGVFPPEGLPTITARLDVLTNKLSEHYQIRNGAIITFAPRLHRK
uniref:Uncharacterized protein n=1 Tax=Trichobilharzia regenti TaxID=157069 RepID=A0AA85K6T2_TRIRE|nr:unnamed protein product [Trichobilharzia regenti]